MPQTSHEPLGAPTGPDLFSRLPPAAHFSSTAISLVCLQASFEETAALLQASAAADRAQPAPGTAQLPGTPAAPDAELVWQADRLQQQVAALQEEREALAQHLDHMQYALAAAKVKGAPLR